MNGSASRSFQDCIYFERFELHFSRRPVIGFARSYTHQPSSALGLARVISRFNGLAVPGVGINFNRSYLDRANIVKFMRTGLLLALSFSLSLSLSLFSSLFVDWLKNPLSRNGYVYSVNERKIVEKRERTCLFLL